MMGLVHSRWNVDKVSTVIRGRQISRSLNDHLRGTTLHFHKIFSIMVWAKKKLEFIHFLLRL